jgi:hypothetical protein
MEIQPILAVPVSKPNFSITQLTIIEANQNRILEQDKERYSVWHYFHSIYGLLQNFSPTGCFTSIGYIFKTFHDV